MPSETALLLRMFGITVVLIFVIGFYILLRTRNLLRMIIALEVLAKGSTLAIIVAGYLTGQMGLAQALAITMIIIEVAVTVVAAGITLCVYRHNQSLDVTQLSNLKG